ncbi:class I SAM-dependent methyltransferase [bacterium]|nr:class I SAM-dependent methyltransferase [bacterium]
MAEDFKQPPGQYAIHRPRYHRELFQWLASISPSNRCAWDCATGAGQAAVGLAEFFDIVLATDINKEQIDHAEPHHKIQYSVSPAEQNDFKSQSIDLITVACGVHWFDRKQFFETAKRLLIPKGVIAVWTYKWPWTNSKEVDRVLAKLKDTILENYWPQESKLYFSGYADIDFPFEEIQVPPFTLECDWQVEDLIGFISTWSAVQRYLRVNGKSPIELVKADLIAAWKSSPPKLPLELPLYFRVGYSP